MGVGHVYRLFRIVMLLQTRRKYNVPGLAEELGVSQRTVYRDLNGLALAHVPCRYDREEQGYCLGGDFFLPPVQLTLGEAMSLSLLASQLARQRQIPFLHEAWPAMLKVQSQLPAVIRQELAAANEHVVIQGARTSRQDAAGSHFQLLNHAIAQRRKVRCVYDGGSDGDSARAFVFRPYAVYFNQRAWYVIGYSEHRAQERCLKLNRLKQCLPTDLPYMIPDRWTIQSYLGDAWRMIRGDTRYQVRIHFDAEFARTVTETLWHPTQQVHWQDDGSCIFQCQVDGLSEIVWWVLAYGPHATVLQPPELRDQVRQLATATAGRYDQPAKPTAPPRPAAARASPPARDRRPSRRRDVRASSLAPIRA